MSPPPKDHEVGLRHWWENSLRLHAVGPGALEDVISNAAQALALRDMRIADLQSLLRPGGATRPQKRHQTAGSRPVDAPGGQYLRTPQGTINNCMLANSGVEVDPEHGPCQICNGVCPDRAAFAEEASPQQPLQTAKAGDPNGLA